MRACQWRERSRPPRHKGEQEVCAKPQVLGYIRRSLHSLQTAQDNVVFHFQNVKVCKSQRISQVFTINVYTHATGERVEPLSAMAAPTKLRS